MTTDELAEEVRKLIEQIRRLLQGGSYEHDYRRGSI